MTHTGIKRAFIFPAQLYEAKELKDSQITQDKSLHANVVWI